MVATLSPRIEPVAVGRPVTIMLASVHDQWITRIAQLLAPAMAPRAGFWERWGAARFLADEFEDHFRMECRLAESLAPLLPPGGRFRLARARVSLERTMAELLAAGRRRGTGPQVSLLARRLLDQARQWCAALELATLGLTVDLLPEESRDLLGHLRAAAALDL